MAQANVEIVREIYERWGRGDFSAGVERYHPDVTLVLRNAFPDAGTYRGPEAIATYMREDFLADLDGAAIAGEEFIDGGDCVVVRVHQRATGSGSGVPVAMRYFQVWTLRDGAVIRIEATRDRAEALAAAGLSD